VNQIPKLRKAVKSNPLYPLNSFPAEFKKKLAQHICVHLATRSNADLEGKDWERIFAECINAQWSPSNVGLDDITHIQSSTAWGAKTVKGKVATSPTKKTNRTVRLISGRNSPAYSFDKAVDRKKHDPNLVGGMVLEIWNSRVKEVRAKFTNLRTAVLIKDKDLSKVAVFEFDTDLYPVDQYSWKWNKNNNLEGFNSQGVHKFTWQPHGSQFTIVEDVPLNVLKLSIKKPKEISSEAVLKQIGFDDTFYSVL
jgi:hypothetical protein